MSVLDQITVAARIMSLMVMIKVFVKDEDGNASAACWQLIILLGVKFRQLRRRSYSAA